MRNAASRQTTIPKSAKLLWNSRKCVCLSLQQKRVCINFKEEAIPLRIENPRERNSLGLKYLIYSETRRQKKNAP